MIAIISPLAVILGTGVANASLDDTAQAPGAPPIKADWLSLTHHGQGQGSFPANLLAADSWSRVQAVDAPDSPAVDQEPIPALCAHISVDPGRCTVTAVNERPYARVDFNLLPEHRFATLTDRQESSASRRKCAIKTIRRHAARARDTLTYLLLSPPVEPVFLPAQSALPADNNLERDDLDDAVRSFWQL
ncbi:hypothetical protein [Nocardia sp. NBC_01009]|uniref:hypothetical protein n=1 Tax=Nocardia sp. NBC_01009 TaxID=2975996 RepID=UPI00386911C5|nr:hypothetical protein OHA42_25240 [Nocardia sp. NBC_01009]